tara:strand:+ start:24754 stop:25890 length:1137 start_codon:yes stop_codon:yes gene_type:complete
MNEGLMFSTICHTIMTKRRGQLYPRLVLVIIVLGQVTIAPIIGFSLTYLLRIERVDDRLSFNLNFESLEWIIFAGLIYGFISLILALVAGGYRPTSIANKGGWLTVLGIRRSINSTELADNARLDLHRSPYGKMARLVNSNQDDFDVLSIHGGLQILAVPVQVALIAIPLAIMEGIPSEYIEQGRAFQLGMIGYFVALWFGLRMQPIYSRPFIGIAAMFRKTLSRISKFSWILPIIIFWFCARLSLEFGLRWLEVDYSVWHNVQLEAILLKTIMPEQSIPDGAIIDFLVAMSVLPVAVFTTISVLGGAHDMPDWMRDQEEKIENLKNPQLEEKISPNDTAEENIETDFKTESTTIEREDKSEEERSRMIDIPFNLFDD